MTRAPIRACVCARAVAKSVGRATRINVERACGHGATHEQKACRHAHAHELAHERRAHEHGHEHAREHAQACALWPTRFRDFS
eukprot:5269953-Pleurochrysis_carterae.AAC.4